jgi:hypothetical protein
MKVVSDKNPIHPMRISYVPRGHLLYTWAVKCVTQLKQIEYTHSLYEYTYK